VPDPAPGPEQHAIQAEARSQVWAAIQNLKAPLREAILLRYWAGHTYREIADIVGCPLRTAQSRVRLAFQQLRADFAFAELNGKGLEEETAL
jgi:RNA polymerase sigma-70 factor (ECF subfamily)